ELFGHARGAFTDAQRARAGLIPQANGGTLFLDEIAELPRALQPKLLRALQERSIRPVGADEEIPFDVRFVAATNRDLEAAVEAGGGHRTEAARILGLDRKTLYRKLAHYERAKARPGRAP